MPTIPLYEQQTQASGSVQSRADPSDFGAQVAQAGSNLAGGLMDAYTGTQVRVKADAAFLKQQEEKDAQSWTGTAVSQAMIDWTQNLSDRKAAAQPGAPNFTPGVLNDFDDYKSKLIASAPTDTARRFITAHMDEMRARIGDQAILFEAGARAAQKADNANTTIENSAKVVQQDPGQYQFTLQLIRSTLPDVGPEAKSKLDRIAVQQLTNAAAAHQLDVDPYALKDATGKAMGEKGASGPTGVPWVDDATPQQVEQWNSQAAQKIARIDNANAAALAAREADAVKALDTATGMSEKGQYFSPEMQSELIQTTAGTKYADQANALINSQKQVAGFASAPADARQRGLEQMRQAGADPTKGLSPEDSATLGRASKIQDGITAAIKDNAWQAASTYGVQGIDSTQRIPTNMADAIGLVTLRAGQQSRLEAWTGAPTSPLQPDEAAAVGKMIRSMQPDQAATALAALGAIIKDPNRIGAIAKQFDDKDGTLGLAMAYAGNSTTMGRTVSELLLRGDQALKDKRTEVEVQKAEQWRANIAAQIRGAFSDVDVENKAIDAAVKINAATALNGQDDVDRAVGMATGGITTHGTAGAKIPLPYGMKADDFETKLSALKPADLAPQVPDGVVHIGPATMPLQQFLGTLKDATLVHAGQGLYNVRGGNTLATNAQGQRITIRIAQ